MTAFLFIPSTAGAGLGRRVDFANIGGVFTDMDETTPRRETRQGARLGLIILLLLGAIGDTLLVARPDALAHCLANAPETPSVHRVTHA